MLDYFLRTTQLCSTSLVAQMVKHLPTMWETWVRSLVWEDPLEKEMAIHSSTLAWKTPCTEEHGSLQSMDCKESDTTERLHFLSSFQLCLLTFLVAQLVRNPPEMQETWV